MAREARPLCGRRMKAGDVVETPEGLLLVLSGVGGEAAARCARKLVDKGASALVSWGCAGGLHPRLRPGSLVLPEKVLAPDETRYTADPTWHARLFERLSGRLDVHTRPVVEARDVLRHPFEKRAFFEKFGAVAVDMESASVATVAKGANLPFMAIRAIADTAESSVPDCVAVATDSLGRPRPARFAYRLVRRPLDVLSLLRIAAGFASAMSTLNEVPLFTGSNLLAP